MAQHISIIISTRNRGASVIDTLRSIFTTEYPAYDVILVDQSTNAGTASAVAPFSANPRFRYIHTSTEGLSLSRNIGLQAAQGDVVAHTDDDCTVPSNWLDHLSRAFEVDPQVAMVFCSVEPAPSRPSWGYVPAFVVTRDRILRSLRDLSHGLGMGAGMAYRRAAAMSIGGFDNQLGAGARFRGAEDHDLAIRLLMHGWWVSVTAAVAVTHFGFRSWQDGFDHTQRDFIGIGASYIKPIRCGRWDRGSLALWLPVGKTLWYPFSRLFRGQRPVGLGRLWAVGRGMVAGFCAPMNRQLALYEPVDLMPTASLPLRGADSRPNLGAHAPTASAATEHGS